MKSLLLLLGSLAFLFSDLSGQCVIDTSITVEPIDTSLITIEIEGLVNDDLSDPDQGICGVRLEFEHEYIGDIYIELISPAGQVVRLIGPEVTSGFTNLTQWDVIFVPCGFPASPDPGFSAQWDNDQTWGILNNYTGTYYPYAGCLEDFNTGSANGVWTFRVVDRAQFYGGEIKSIALIFCDPGGLDCNPCNADAGNWVNEGLEVTYCEGDPGLQLDTSLKYSNARPDTNIYSYVWTVAEQDTINELLQTPDLTGFLPGTYTICGLIYRTSEIALLPTSMDTLILDSLRARLLSASPPFCGQLTEECMTVNIVSKPDTTNIDATVCNGDYYVFDTDTFYTPGTYIVNRPFTGNCDSIFRIDVDFVMLNAIITGPDTLDCTNRSIVLDGAGSDTTVQTTFIWTLDGVLLDPGQNDRDVEIRKGGQVQLIISSRGCSDTTARFINVDTAKLEVNLTLDTLGCQKDSVWILATYFGQIVDYSWSGPGVVSQMIDSALINVAGEYTYRVERENGCDTILNFEVIRDERFPDFSFNLDTLTCLKDTVVPVLVNNIPGTVFTWTGPEGNIYFGQSPGFTIPGNYSLNASTPSGCSSDTIFRLFADTMPPVFTLRDDTLGCQPDSIQLDVTPLNPSWDYLWTGPSGFTSDFARPFIRQEGSYMLQVIGDNGCLTVDTVEISKTEEVPDITYDVQHIDCRNPLGGIRAFSPTGISFEWEGPNGYVSNGSEIFGLEAGIYFLTVSDANGCQNTRTIELVEDLDPPDIDLFGDTISCNDPFSVLSFITPDSLESFFWITPGNGTSMDSMLSVAEPGEYLFLSRGTNGCAAEDTIIVVADTLFPIGKIVPVMITCENDSVSLRLDNYLSADTVRWYLPDNTEVLSDSLETSTGGQYAVEITGVNGCIALDSFFIQIDTIIPSLDLSVGIIDCNDPNTAIEIMPGSGVRSWMVSGPAGTVTDQERWMIDIPGTYKVNWIGVNGCPGMDSINVEADTIPPSVQLYNENIDCRGRDTLRIGAVSQDTGLVYSWQGEAGFISEEKDTFVRMPGWYFLTVTAPNGCDLFDSVFVTYDTIAPIWEYYPVDTLSCVNDSIDLIVKTQSDVSLIAFDAVDGRLVNDSTWRTNVPGWILTLVEGQNACITIDSIEIQIDTLTPELQLSGATITCDEPRVMIGADVSPNGGQIRWNGPNGFISFEEDPVVFTPGWYIAEYTLSNGCSVTDSVRVISTADPPQLTIEGGLLPCDGSRIMIQVTADTNNVAYSWSGPGGFSYTGADPEVIEEGVYIVQATAPNGCLAIDSIMIMKAQNEAELILETGVITCFDPEVVVKVNADREISIFNWNGPDGYSGFGDSIGVLSGGWYYVEATDSLKCVITDSVLVTVDTSIVDVTLDARGESGCGTDTVILTASFQGEISNTNWFWEDPTGAIFGSNEDSVIVTTPGLYSIFVRNENNGCENNARIQVRPGNGALAAIVIGEDPVCPGEDDGMLIISSVEGNTGPWNVHINNMDMGQSDLFGDLPDGEYVITIIDSVGCQWDTLIILNEPAPLWVDLGPDITIDQGTPVTLDPKFNPGASGVQVQEWMPEDTACPTCLIRIVTPAVTTRYFLVIMDERGCLARDDKLITVVSDNTIFFPNAFTPNDDGVNDTWIISVGEGIGFIESLQIFDRWGNLVHTVSNMQVQDGATLWDGYFNGKQMNPGVFVYSVSYRTSNGQILYMTGDITLIR